MSGADVCDNDVQRGTRSGTAPGGAHGAGGDRAADALTHHDTTVSALARHLGVDWHTAWNAIEVEAKTRVGQTERLARVKTLGVDEHICGRPSGNGSSGDDHGRSDP
jgi:hypothetical protein